MTVQDLAGIGMTSERTRERMVRQLEQLGIADPRVLEAMRRVPRHIFLDEALAHRAYENTALPIGHSARPSPSPTSVALLAQLVVAEPRRRVLEVGTGSGYQAAVLAQLVERVYTVERIKPLLRKARERFRRLGLRNVVAAHLDGVCGWPEYAPYDAIVVTAAARQVPVELLEQLAPDGVLVIPVGDASRQELRLVRRRGETRRFAETVVAAVRFVPLVEGSTS
ncbi:MAG: protein-L-isoaspartate O-methyltransferase [Porticoccaceae bacterium]|nr:MAG: protein-L-isoaspartate O-methyltransferase [Porticoccaceae bacterium]